MTLLIIIGICAVTVVLGYTAFIGLYLLFGYVSDYPAPVARLVGLAMFVTAIITWWLLLGQYINVEVSR